MHAHTEMTGSVHKPHRINVRTNPCIPTHLSVIYINRNNNGKNKFVVRNWNIESFVTITAYFVTTGLTNDSRHIKQRNGSWSSSSLAISYFCKSVIHIANANANIRYTHKAQTYRQQSDLFMQDKNDTAT